MRVAKEAVMVTFNEMRVQQIVDDPTLSIEDKIKFARL